MPLWCSVYLSFRACSALCIVAQLPRGRALRLRVWCSVLPSGSVSRAQSYSCPMSRCARFRVAATCRPALAGATMGRLPRHLQCPELVRWCSCLRCRRRPSVLRGLSRASLGGQLPQSFRSQLGRVVLGRERRAYECMCVRVWCVCMGMCMCQKMVYFQSWTEMQKCMFVFSQEGQRVSGGASKGSRMATLQKQNKQREDNNPEYKQKQLYLFQLFFTRTLRTSENPLTHSGTGGFQIKCQDFSI